MTHLIGDNTLVLFQGDSITDAGRSREDDAQAGFGYAAMARDRFHALYPEKNVRFLNRGIGGNRVRDLRARWGEDCIDLEPDWVSILIGVNDVWRRYDEDDHTTPEAFEEDYRAILTDVKEKLDAGLIMCEPFLLPITDEHDRWHEDLNPKTLVVRRLAREFGAIYIPFDGLFAAVATRQPPTFWAADGVHPTPAGHALMADAWLRAAGAQ